MTVSIDVQPKFKKKSVAFILMLLYELINSGMMSVLTTSRSLAGLEAQSVKRLKRRAVSMWKRLLLIGFSIWTTYV